MVSTRKSEDAQQCFYFDERPRQVFVRESRVTANAAVPTREPPLLNARADWFSFLGLRLVYFWILRLVVRNARWQVVVLERTLPRFDRSDLSRPGAWWEVVDRHVFATRQLANDFAVAQAECHVPGILAPSKDMPLCPSVPGPKYVAMGIILGLVTAFALGPHLTDSWWINVVPFLGFGIGVASTRSGIAMLPTRDGSRKTAVIASTAIGGIDRGTASRVRR
jgi:hypothetical protein